MPDARRRGLAAAILLPIVVVAALLHLLPRWGVPLQSDVTWIYLLQTSELRPDQVPQALGAFAGRPMNAFEACIAYYDAFGRWNCVDQIANYLTARVSGDDADRWRAAFVLFGAAGVGIFVQIGRHRGIPLALCAFFAVGLMVTPVEVWGEYTASEAKASAFLLAALLLALRGGRLQPAAALAMVLAVLSKEPYLAAWPAVLAAAYAGGGRRALVPHVAAIAAVGALGGGLRLRPPSTDYPSAIQGGYPPPLQWLRDYQAAIMPGLARGPIGAAAVLGGGAVACVALRGRAARARLVAALRRDGTMVMIVGCLAAVAGHGLVYYATKRSIGESRYALPANQMVALAALLLCAALWSALDERWRRRVLVGTAAGLIAGVMVRTRMDEVFILGAALALVVLGGTLAATRRLPSPAIALALLALLLPGPLDAAMADAARARQDQEAWRALVARVASEAPRDGHVRLVFADPGMIETAWGLEAWTLLHGRTDLTYHLTILDTSAFEHGSGPLVRRYVEAFNANRAPLPPSRAAVIEVNADRSGRAADEDRATHGVRALTLLLDPRALWEDRYLSGRRPYLQYTIVPPG